MDHQKYKSLDSVTVVDVEALGIPSELAGKLVEKLAQIVGNYGAATPRTWHHISKELLTPNLPFSFHQMMYYGCYKDFGPDPLRGYPTRKNAWLTNIGQLLEKRGKEFLGSKYEDPISSFSDFQRFSVSDQEVFWKTILEEMNISFSVPPECILRESPAHPGGQWLPGARVNPAKNCLSLKNRTLSDVAIVWQSGGNDEAPVEKMTLQELRESVWAVAHALVTLGLEKGSSIAIDMPMDVNSVVIYLAIVLAGHVVVSIADSFAPSEISTRLILSKAKAIFTQGDPKAIPWTFLTPFKAAADGWCHMDIKKGDVVAWPTNLGWMMGPWLVYTPLLNRASIALYNGSPLGSGFAKFVQFIHDGSCFGSTGETSSVDEYLWLMGRAEYKPIIEYCGGTEIGGSFVSGSMLQPQSLAAFSTAVMGCSLHILGDDGFPIPSDVPGIGELALGPLMFGASSTLLNADHNEIYFKGMPVLNGKVLRRHGDVFERTSKGYYHAHGRADDTMNLGGIKVSSLEIERICNSVDENILETAAVGVPPAGGGPEKLVIAVVFKDLDNLEHNLVNLMISFNTALRRKLNPLFKVSSIVPLPSLPRTATNKVMRRILRQQFYQADQGSRL
ncbi:unnamed protein product [Withania somnifera]